MTFDIKADRLIIEKATPGPWKLINWTVQTPGDLHVCTLDHKWHETGLFIADARTRWPAALDEIERLQCQLANQKAAREDFESLVYDLITERDKFKAENERLQSQLAKALEYGELCDQHGAELEKADALLKASEAVCQAFTSVASEPPVHELLTCYIQGCEAMIQLDEWRALKEQKSED